MSSRGDDRIILSAPSVLMAPHASANLHEEAECVFRQGVALFAQSRNKDAARACRMSLVLRPHHAESLHLLGVLSYLDREFDVAARLLRRALALDRKNHQYHSNLGGALQAMGKLDEAAVR
jgi:Flp pilus assembly protein TadD